MDTTELGLPQYLFTETMDTDGAVTGTAIKPDRLIDWSGSEYGNAIGRLCQQVCDQDIDAIDAREQARLLQLEDRWMMVENGVDDDELEQQYDRDCDAVAREAAASRKAAETRMVERKSAIEQLVLQARNHIDEQEPAPQEESLLGYLIALVVVSVMAYVLIT